MYLMRFWTRAEVALVSVERLQEFCELDSEAPTFIDANLPNDWPRSGGLVIQDLAVRYASDLPKVLEGVSLEVAPGSKVALVGATGSGKSTLSLAIMRIVEACEGKILIDGVDVSRIGLHDLRSRITIVPQDPVRCGNFVW